MPLSTSSSSRAPAGPWFKTIGIGLLFAFAFLGVIEVAGRARGMTPHYQDTPRHWAYWRGQANSNPEVVALLGSSRTQLGIDPDQMSEVLGRPVVNLAMNGATPLPVLHQLAGDQRFVGTAIVEGYPSALFSDDDSRRQSMQPWLQFYTGRSEIDDIEARLRAGLQGSLVSARPDFRPTLFAVTLLVHRRLPQEGYSKMHFNRWVAADYQQPHPSNENWTIDPSQLLSEADIQARFANVRASVAAIEKRGGKVVFFRTPSSGHVRETEQRVLPRERFWDRFVRETGVNALHFEDVDSMRNIKCGDGGHLDMRDVPHLSQSLARTLVERGLL